MFISGFPENDRHLPVAMSPSPLNRLCLSLHFLWRLTAVLNLSSESHYVRDLLGKLKPDGLGSLSLEARLYRSAAFEA